MKKETFISYILQRIGKVNLTALNLIKQIQNLRKYCGLDTSYVKTWLEKNSDAYIKQKSVFDAL